MPPLVSVIITTYNRNERAREAIESVQNQTYENIEVILVDGSGDRNAENLTDEYPQIRYVAQTKNKGLIADRNRGYKLTSGRYIHFLDDDDRLRPEKIEKQIKLFDMSSEIGVVYTGLYREKDDKNLLPRRSDHEDFLETVLKQQQPPCYPSSMLIERDVIDQIMPQNPRWDGADDIVLEIQLAQRTQFDSVKEPLLIRGEEDTSMAVTRNAVETRREVIHEFSDLYDKYPDTVRQTALAGTYNAEGKVVFKNTRWSPRAIAAFSKAAYYHPDIRTDLLMSAFISCFGRGPWLLGRRALVKFRKM